MEIQTQCPFCADQHIVDVDRNGYVQWSIGDKLIQDALPTLSSDDRERLLTGICPDCWNESFGED